MLNIQERAPETIQNPGADTKILFNDSTDGLLKTKDSSGVVETLATTEGIAAAEPKVYIALLTQTGTDAPVATVLKNTLGGTVVWTYGDVGLYIGTLAGAFTNNRTVGVSGDIVNFHRINVYNSLTGNENRGYFIKKQDEDALELYTFSAADVTSNDILSATCIKIEVYP